MVRAAVFIDGFNLFHAIDDLGDPYLKWSNYWRMSELLVERDEHLSLVLTATAYYPDFRKKVRHERHLNALRNVGVTVLLGHYVEEDASCRQCGHKWKKKTEKEGDINLSLAVLDAAYKDLFDHAYLVTADSDHAATVKLLVKRFPSKMISSVAPPGRSHSKAILADAKKCRRTLDREVMDLSVFPKIVTSATGRPSVIRPFEYDPPAGWVHLDLRPK
jgi:hypothetical protein